MALRRSGYFEYTLVSSVFLTLFVLFTRAANETESNKTDPVYWGIKNDSKSASDLTKKTLGLKQQALKILELRGVENYSKTKLTKAEAKWDDIQMTEDLYANLKATFDEELKKLEDAIKYPNDTNRATAPDFALIPFAKWTTMPIKFSTALVQTRGLKQKIRDALQQIQDKTDGCVSFTEVDRRPSESFIAYKEVRSLGPGVCADSPLGRQQDVNIINVATTCQVFGTLIHETLHSLGFAHTQQRPDVDQYLTINWRNIPQDAAPNFKPWKYALKNQGPFDFGSILMYPRTAFAIDSSRDTLTPKKDQEENGALMGQRNHLSDEDIKILKKVYGCGAGAIAIGKSGRGKVAATEKPASGGACDDKFLFSCSFWKGRGYCSSSSTLSSFVKDNCAKTCKLC